MSEFTRENRYIVIKRSDLDKLYKDPTKYATTFGHALALIVPHLPKRKFLVIESDWAEYEPAWQMIERRISGTPDELTAAQSELAALREELANLRESYESMRDRKNSIVDLQQRLTAAEQRNASLREALDSVAFYFRQHGVDQQLREIVEEALCLDKLTESGASE